MAIRCKACGVESTYDEVFTTEWSLRGRSHRCPQCTRQQSERQARNSLWMWLALPALSAACFGISRVTNGVVASVAKGNAWFLANTVLFQVFLLLVIPPHELGHAVAAYAMRFRIFAVILGVGPLVYERKVAGIRVRLNRYPIAGATIAAPPPNATHLRRKWLVMVAAGPAVNVILALVALPFVGGFLTLSLHRGPAIPLVILGANLITLVINLVPIRQAPGLNVPNDGYQLFAIPFAKPERLRQMLAAHYLLEAELHRESDRNDEAIACLERGLRAHPGVPELHLGLGFASSLAGQCENAREQFLLAAASPDANPAVRATAQNNAAWADVVTMPNDRLDEADRLSKEALAVLGWMPAILGTRGAVLVERGELAEGMRLLIEALRQSSELHPMARATYSAALALALVRDGKLAGAQEALTAAKSQLAACPSIPRAEAELAAAQAR